MSDIKLNSSLDSVNDIFKIPIMYNNCSKKLNETIVNDLELITSIDKEESSIYDNVFNLTNKPSKKIVERLNKICTEFSSESDYNKVGNTIYEFCSTNKFYSKVFADLFAELCVQYTWIMPIFNEKYADIMSQYSDIQYVDSEKNYDGFCDMNKKNDRRRSVTTFLMSLAINGFIKKDGVIKILRDLLELVSNMIDKPDHKNEVDELTENIAILFNKDMIDEVSNNSKELCINGKTILEIINNLAKTKAKDHQSLSNKAIFKFMDLIEM